MLLDDSFVFVLSQGRALPNTSMAKSETCLNDKYMVSIMLLNITTDPNLRRGEKVSVSQERWLDSNDKTRCLSQHDDTYVDRYEI